MTRFEYQFPQTKYLPSVSASASSTKLPPTLRRSSVRGTAHPRVHPGPGAPARDVPGGPGDAPARTSGSGPTGPAGGAGNDLDCLTEDDRDLIEAVTGEHIEPGQRPQDRPVSPFAMQVAVDRRNGRLGAGLEVSGAYLQRTNRLLLRLNVPANPFSGETLDRALDYVERKTRGLLGRKSAAPGGGPAGGSGAEDDEDGSAGW